MRKITTIISLAITLASCSKSDSNTGNSTTGKCSFTYTTNNQTYNTGSDCLYVGWTIKQEDSTEIWVSANETNSFSIVPFRISLYGRSLLQTGVGTYKISTRHNDMVIETLGQVANERPVEWYIISGTINVNVATQNNLQASYSIRLQNIDDASLFKNASGSVNLFQ